LEGQVETTGRCNFVDVAGTLASGWTGGQADRRAHVVMGSRRNRSVPNLPRHDEPSGEPPRIAKEFFSPSTELETTVSHSRCPCIALPPARIRHGGGHTLCYPLTRPQLVACVVVRAGTIACPHMALTHYPAAAGAQPRARPAPPRSPSVFPVSHPFVPLHSHPTPQLPLSPTSSLTPYLYPSSTKHLTPHCTPLPYPSPFPSLTPPRTPQPALAPIFCTAPLALPLPLPVSQSPTPPGPFSCTSHVLYRGFRPLCHLNWAKVRTKATASEFASYSLVRTQTILL